MKKRLSKLVEISSAPVSAVSADVDTLRAAVGEDAAKMLAPLLGKKNGFFAFESALQVFPFTADSPYGLVEWNSAAGWRRAYGNLIPDDTLFFAQDLFGCQFAIHEGEISRFDPEVAEFEFLAENISDWAAAVMEDYNYLTGFELGHDWQVLNRPLVPNERLFPRIPFVLGGDFEVENLWAAFPDAVMSLRGALASQLHGLPDGTKVRVRWTEDRVIESVLRR